MGHIAQAGEIFYSGEIEMEYVTNAYINVYLLTYNLI